MAEEKKKETTTEWVKKWGKRGFFGGIILLVIAAVGIPRKKESGVVVTSAVYHPQSKAQEINWPVPKAVEAKFFPRKYVKVYDISRTTDAHFVLEVEMPENEWVSVALPPWYRVVSSHDVWVEYDWGLPSKGNIKEPPGQSPEGGNIPLAFDTRGMGKAGKLIIRGYRQTPKPQPVGKEVKKVSSKKTRIAKKAVRNDPPSLDVPSGPQIM